MNHLSFFIAQEEIRSRTHEYAQGKDRPRRVRPLRTLREQIASWWRRLAVRPRPAPQPRGSLGR